MQRITKSDLEHVVRAINSITDSPLEPYTDGKPNAHCYHLSGAYGGYGLHRMCSSGTGIHDILGGHMPKRELYERMQAFKYGLMAAKDAAA